MAVQREPLIDVLVIGGGPAGLATAIELRGLDVVVCEAGGEPGERFGESVPPDILLALERLDLTGAFRADGHCPCPGTISLWGSDRPGHNDAILNPLGPAWHISRARFEAMLRAKAVQSGATLLTRTRVVAAERGGEGFAVRLGDGRTVRTRWVVDASGWRAWFARRQGAVRRRHDRIVAIVRFAALRSGTFTAQTVVEATPDGWWYCAAVPGERVVTVLMTDGSAARALADDGYGGWRALLATTRLLAPRLDACRLDDEHFRSHPVTSSILDRVEGDGWLAVGDAASTYDPIAAQGIYKALADAADGARTITATANDYGERIRERFDDYLANRAHLYALEQRWPDRPFWRERGRSPTSMAPLVKPA